MRTFCAGSRAKVNNGAYRAGIGQEPIRGGTPEVDRSASTELL